MTQHVPAKRAFLKGNFHARAALRPFGAMTPGAFEEACNQCGACARACPEAIIYRDSDGLPVLNFQAGECTFCAACIEVCDPQALQMEQPWNWQAVIGRSCMSLNGIACRACEDHCDARAIRFRLETGGRATPSVDPASCTGCGACAAPCPSSAISFALPAADTTPAHDGGHPC